MIRDLSQTLQAMLDDPALESELPELFAAQIAFDRPSDTFAPSGTTVDLFLFDIRENTELRNSEPTAVRAGGQVTLKKAPKRFSCSYLVTAWPSGSGDLNLMEHRLLGQALQVFSRYPKIPGQFLRGSLAGQQPDLPLISAHPEGIRDPADFWAAIGNKLRPSFIVTATFAMELFPSITAPEVISSRVEWIEAGAGPEPVRYRFAGRVTDGGGAPVADADVALPSEGLAVRTDGEGRYQIGAVAAGTYSLQVSKGGQSKTVSVTLPPTALAAYDVQL